MYTITLSDGTILNNLEQSGNTYISSTAYTAEDFEGKLGAVTFSDGTESYLPSFTK